jgi:hypothetical protein
MRHCGVPNVRLIPHSFACLASNHFWKDFSLGGKIFMTVIPAQAGIQMIIKLFVNTFFARSKGP